MVTINLLTFQRNLMALLSLLLSGNLMYAHVIQTRLGLLEGVTKEARGGKLFYAYYGVRYAKPPIGELRFQPPVAADPWTGIFNATKKPEMCPQIEDESKMYKGIEDCLHLIIYTPTNLKPRSNIPVLFYIFGGVFNHGNALREGPEFLMSRDVIIVMVTNRLGVLGLLSTGDTVIPGNMALKDQTLAMKWTKENIYEFGGDPDKITLHGHSSGASCVHLHTLSPLSKQYFHQTIMQSGLGINPQSFRSLDEGREVSHTLAAMVNCPTNSSEILKECLQRKAARELVEATLRLYIWGNQEPAAAFRPVVEDRRVENAFLTENPLDASYASESKPMLVGMTSGEAAKIVTNYQSLESGVRNVNTNLLLPIIGCYSSSSKPNYLNFITRAVRTCFSDEKDGNNVIAEMTDVALVKVLSGLMLGYGLIDVVEKYKGLKYLYLFDYRYVGGYAESKFLANGSEGRFLGVAHADEIPLIFNHPNVTGIAEEDYAFGDEMITRWINFIYSGNPNVPFPINVDVLGAWSPVSSSQIEFLRILYGGGMEKDYFLETYGFWRKFPIFSKYLDDFPTDVHGI